MHIPSAFLVNTSRVNVVCQESRLWVFPITHHRRSSGVESLRRTTRSNNNNWYVFCMYSQRSYIVLFVDSMFRCSPCSHKLHVLPPMPKQQSRLCVSLHFQATRRRTCMPSLNLEFAILCKKTTTTTHYESLHVLAICICMLLSSRSIWKGLTTNTKYQQRNWRGHVSYLLCSQYKTRSTVLYKFGQR